MNWNRVRKTGAIACILLSTPPPIAFAQQDSKPKAITTSGNLSHDVLQALVILGELDAAPSDPTSSLARSAISKAERRLGLPADGIADQNLFDRLAAEALQSDNGEVSKDGFSSMLDVGKTLTAIIVGIGGLVLGFLKLRQQSRAKATGSA